MSETEGRFSKVRLEAFSDGVIAVIITIMVLDRRRKAQNPQRSSSCGLRS